LVEWILGAAMQAEATGESLLYQFRLITFTDIVTRKAQLMHRATRDSDACVKARCKWNL